MWKITILNDRSDDSEVLYIEHVGGSQDAAAERATVLLGEHCGIRADIEPA